MKHSYLIVIFFFIFFIFNGKTYEESVIERISLPVEICVEGEECGIAVNSSDKKEKPKGAKLYAGCVACHGAKGEGGIGPLLKGRSVDYLSEALYQYKNKEERGPQSVLMYSQAAGLSDKDIKDLSKYITTL